MVGGAPKAPDPKETAAAQTGTNVSTALANAALGNVNQKTPWGDLSYSTTGYQFIDDANGQEFWRGPNGEIVRERPQIAGAATGETRRVPIYSERGGQNGAKYISGYKDEAVTGAPTFDDKYTSVKGYYIPTTTATTTLTPAQQAILDQTNGASLNLASLANDRSAFLKDYLSKSLDLSQAPAAGTAGAYTAYGAAPSLLTSFGDAGKITDTIANAGAIQREIGDAGDITRTYGTDFSADRQRVEDALMQRQQPYLDQARKTQDARLANQGIQLGSEAYRAAQDDRARAENDARLANILAGGQEQSRLAGLERDRAVFENSAQAQKYGQLLSSGQFANAAQAQQYGQNAGDAAFANSAQAQRYGQLFDRANFSNNATQQNFSNQFQTTQANNALQTQRFNEQNALRSQWLNEQYAARANPINEISSLLSGTAVQSPQFVNTNMPTIPTTDVAGITQQDYQNRMAAYQQKQAMLGGLLGGIGSLFSLSDKRAKTDIKKQGSLMDLGVYNYRYKGKHDDGRRHVGVMAQEVEKKMPEAVATGPDGLKRVNYGLLLKRAA